MDNLKELIIGFAALINLKLSTKMIKMLFPETSCEYIGFYQYGLSKIRKCYKANFLISAIILLIIIIYLTITDKMNHALTIYLRLFGFLILATNGLSQYRKDKYNFSVNTKEKHTFKLLNIFFYLIGTILLFISSF